MLLVIDVGNTNIVLGVFKGKELLDHWRISTNKLRTTDEYGVLIRDLFYLNDVNSEDIDSIIISSVVPPVMPTLERMCQRYFGLVPLIIGPGVKTGMDIKYDNPREVGADRIVNAVAAYAKYGGPVIIIDFGTATTFCAVDKKGNYLGGSICPGIGISTDALVQRTAEAAAYRNPPYGKSHLPQYGGKHAGRRVLRLCRPDRRHCQSHAQGIGRQRQGRRDRRLCRRPRAGNEGHRRRRTDADLGRIENYL